MIVDKENEKEKKGLRLSHWSWLLSIKRKGGPPPPPLPSFTPEAGEQTLNYILKVPLALELQIQSRILQKARPVACTRAESRDRSIRSQPSGAGTLLLQTPTLPSFLFLEPRIQYRRPRPASRRVFQDFHPPRKRAL